MKPILHNYPKLRRFFSRASSLLMLFQKSPIIQILMPEARLLSSSATADAVKMTIATVAGLGIFDSVTGATAVIQKAPSSGATVPATTGDVLNFVFQAIGTGGHGIASFQVTGALPTGLTLNPGVTNGTIGSISGTPSESGTFAIQIQGYEYANNTGRFAQGSFTLNVIPGVPTPAAITTQPSSTFIKLGASVSLNVGASGSPPFTYQWYQGPQGDTSTPVGSNSNTLDTGAINATTSYWVNVSNAENLGGAQSGTAVVTVDTRVEYCGASNGGAVSGFSGTIQWNRDETLAIDGIAGNNNRWQVSGFPNYIEFDLGENKAISRTEFFPYNGFSYQYIVEAKPDGGVYTQVLDRSNNQTTGTSTVLNPISDEFAPVIARYVKVTISGIGNSSYTICSVNEFKVFGIPANEQLMADWKANHFSAIERADALISGDTSDPDHDHLSNAEEYIFGTSPVQADGAFVPEIVENAGQYSVHFTAKLAAGVGYVGKTRHYAIEVASDLTAATPWAPLSGFVDVIGSDQEVWSDIPSNGDRRKFYRIKTWLTP